jgi:hypothetical protein
MTQSAMDFTLLFINWSQFRRCCSIDDAGVGGSWMHRSAMAHWSRPVCGLAPVPLPLMFAISIAARMLDRVLRERSDRW